jgi:peptidoglycan/xylan/chitin deacetylase (PgdA/CDA1 family)
MKVKSTLGLKIFILMLLLLGVSACGKDEPQPQRTPVAIHLPATEAPAPATGLAGAPSDADATPAALPTPTRPSGPAATIDPNITPEPPALFQTKNILRVAKPVTYIDDTCEYLRLRWDPNNAEPGTVIVPVMYHRVKHAKGERGVDQTYFKQTMRAAHRLGYETITAQQAVDFLYHNAKIPRRSLMLFVDDRRVPVIQEDFMPFLKQYHWTVISAWIISNTDDIPGLWERIEALYATGHVDVQSHSLRHVYIVPGTPKKTIREEIYGPIPYFEEHFGYRPIAYVWPGGNYTRYAVRTAREAGYRIGFTIYPNGPVMFNWVPLQEADRKIGDPLLTLPRYHANAIKDKLPLAAEMGEQARQQALDHYPQEAAWYRLHCSGELPAPAFGP